MIPETREFEFANLGFIPLSYYKNRDYACFFSANSAQKPALYDTADATANSRIVHAFHLEVRHRKQLHAEEARVVLNIFHHHLRVAQRV